MATSRVFFMDIDENCPFIDYSLKKNRKHDWTRILRMLEGKIEMDSEYINSINILIKTKSKFDILAIEIDFLVSERAKIL